MQYYKGLTVRNTEDAVVNNVLIAFAFAEI